MRFRFLLSGPHGDIVLAPEDLAQPFLTSPSQKHPFLMLKDYFGALQKFISMDNGDTLTSILKEELHLPTDSLANITDIEIRSEKHGAFYHIASITLIGLGKRVRFAVTTALEDGAKASLADEFCILQQLAKIEPEFLPEVYCQKIIPWQTGNKAEEFLMVAGEWLDSYHEWHLSNDAADGRQKILIWDYDRGCRYLTGRESYELLHQAAFILTCYYDQASFRQIYPWHHAAGDFVVNVQPHGLSVKLITARQHETLVHFAEEEEADQLVAAIHFLLNLVLRMRLDRLDGVGPPAWFAGYAVDSAVAGFFAGLGKSAAAKRLLVEPAAFLEIMQSFTVQEIYDMYESLLEIYVGEDQDDFRLIQEKLHEHAVQLHETLTNYLLPEQPRG